MDDWVYILLDCVLAVVLLGVGFAAGFVVGNMVGYRRGWHSGLTFRNGCYQEQQNAMSEKDFIISSQKQAIREALERLQKADDAS